MTQALMIDVFGRPVTAYKDDNVIDLSKMGRQSIARFSEVLFDEGAQLFHVVYRDTAPERLRGGMLTLGQYFAATDSRPPSEGRLQRLRGWQGKNHNATAFFQTYGDAIYGEQRVLEWLMMQGQM